jgi:hypothetical protein
MNNVWFKEENKLKPSVPTFEKEPERIMPIYKNKVQ